MPRGGKRENAGRPKTGRKPDISVTISEKAEARLTEMAEKAGTSKSAVIEAAINERSSPMSAVLEFKNFLKEVETETLKTLDFIVQKFPISPTPADCKTKEQESIEVDTMRWLVQRELDSRKAGELPYSWGEMYLALNIPKEFLD